MADNIDVKQEETSEETVGRVDDKLHGQIKWREGKLPKYFSH